MDERNEAPFLEELERLKPRGHRCLIYETEEQWCSATVTFVRTGLGRGEKCVYVTDTHTARKVRTRLGEQGVDVPTAEASGQLAISHETETFTRDGVFDPGRMIAFLVAEAEKTIAEGYPALCVTGEMSWVLRGYAGSEKLVEFEAKLNRDFFPRYACTALCQYDRRRFNLPLLLDVISTHPITMIGTAVYDNPYYIPAAEFLNRKCSLADLQHWMDSLAKRKCAEERAKQLEKELYFTRRLASIGQLAAGVAHEINNPLTGILGFSQRALRKSTDETVARDLERIHSEALRVATVVQNLLAFAHRPGPRKEYADINHIVQKALELRAYELEVSNIEVVANLAPNLPQTMVDFSQIQQVFLNIILNAEQVMTEVHGSGKLSITTKKIRDYIRISFADDGPGIPAENLDKLFDPFFTTRSGRGATGLGLSVCHGIVAEHGGKIYAQSELGKGADFFVELPTSIEKIGENEVEQDKRA